MQSLNKRWAGDLIASIFMDEGKISKTYSLHLYFQEQKKGFSGRELWDLLSPSFLILSASLAEHWAEKIYLSSERIESHVVYCAIHLFL